MNYDMKSTVLQKIIEGQKLPLLFVGSGISKRYLYNFPDWETLLRTSFKQVNPDPFFIQQHINQFTNDGLSPFQIFARLGSIIEREYNEAFYARKVQLKVGHPKNPKWVRQNISPYKMYLSHHFRKMRLNRDLNLQREISLFKELKNKISGVVTTNYDSFLENTIFPDDYEVFIHQHELFSSRSFNIAEIYKIHGCVSDASSIVITEEDYSNFEQSRKLIIAKMLTLFADSPIIFLGYSMTDENIQSIISEFLGCLSPEDLTDIQDHFIFVSYKQGEQRLVEKSHTITTAARKSIPISEIETDNFLEIFTQLNKITPSLSPGKIRSVRRIVKTIVDQTISSKEGESIIVGIDDLDNMEDSSRPLAIAIGYKENILSKVGYGLLETDKIFEDIIFDNQGLDPNHMCNSRLQMVPTTQLMPVYKYAHHKDSTFPENSRLSNYILLHDSLDRIVPNHVHKTLKTTASVDSYSQLLEILSTIDKPNNKAGFVLKNINVLNVDELRKICKTLTMEEGIYSSTHFKRCVMCLDFFENCKEKRK